MWNFSASAIRFLPESFFFPAIRPKALLDWLSARKNM
jgi:hypothetical protein